VHFNVQGYLDEFSRALATEVRMLLGEVGRIREERRALQHEIGDLLSMKAKYGPGGEYEPEWKPPPGPPPADDMPPPPDMPGVPPQVKPAWRKVPAPRPKKKKKNMEAQAHVQAHPVASTSAPPPQMTHVVRYPDPSTQMRESWATWLPDRTQVTPPSVEPTLVVQARGSPGLFGTPSESSMYEQRR